MNSSSDPKHTGEAPARRPPDDEPERIGEGELGSDGPPVGSIQTHDEDFATEGGEILGDSKPADALHRKRRRDDGKLTIGSGGDAAPPGIEAF